MQGLSNREALQKLGLTGRAVGNHPFRIYENLEFPVELNPFCIGSKIHIPNSRSIAKDVRLLAQSVRAQSGVYDAPPFSNAML